MNILNHVDILDLVTIQVFQDRPTPFDPAPVRVFIQAKDNSKNIVFDESTLNVLNNKITEVVLSKQLSLNDGKTFEYIKEYVGRMISELHKNGLVAFEDAKEASEDPYELAKKLCPRTKI